MQKKLSLQINNENIKDSVEKYFKDKNIEICDMENADLIALYDSDCKVNKKTINLHPSLLPSFKNNNAIKEAFLEGVKVSGITVHQVEENNFYGKILAQIPVLIGNDTHFDEFEAEIINLATKIYPKVIEKIINEEVFDFDDLFKNNCSGSCSNCGECSH